MQSAFELRHFVLTKSPAPEDKWAVLQHTAKALEPSMCEWGRVEEVRQEHLRAHVEPRNQ